MEIKDTDILNFEITRKEANLLGKILVHLDSNNYWFDAEDGRALKTSFSVFKEGNIPEELRTIYDKLAILELSN